MSKLLPLVHLSLLRPILDGLRERGIDPESVAENAGLTEDAIMSGDGRVHVMVVHHFLEEAAAAAKDPTFAATVGLQLNPNGWPMIKNAVERARTLGDFLNIYVSQANEVSSSVVAYLEIRDKWAVFGERRLFKPAISPSQNDGFMASLSLSILKFALGRALDPAKVTIIVCNRTALPPEFSSFQLLQGDDMGFRIQFPSDWLAMDIDPGTPDSIPQSREGERSSERGFLQDFRSLLRQHVGGTPLSADRAAKLVAMSRSKLARRLSAFGSNISSEIKRVEIEFAQERLRSSKESIGEVAAALGYADAANFTRAFRRIVGKSPSDYRKNQTSIE